MAKRTVGALLFPEFELLDVFGPLEAFGVAREHFEVVCLGERAGAVASAQGPEAVASAALGARRVDLLLVPGGLGTRREVGNAALLAQIVAAAREVEVLMSVCTGAALLARAGLLDGKRATTNKRAFGWVKEQGPCVDWVAEARWVDAGTVVTSSGVSAGIDMALAVIARTAGRDVADDCARIMEYDWHRDAGWDPFAKIYDLA